MTHVIDLAWLSSNDKPHSSHDSWAKRRSAPRSTRSQRPDVRTGLAILSACCFSNRTTCPALQVKRWWIGRRRVRKCCFNEAGEVAGTPSTGEISPGRIAVDSDGNVPVAARPSARSPPMAATQTSIPRGHPEDCATENDTWRGVGLRRDRGRCSRVRQAVMPPHAAAQREPCRLRHRQLASLELEPLLIGGITASRVIRNLTSMDATMTPALKGPTLDDLTVWAESDSSYSYYSDEFPCTLKPGDEITVQPGELVD